MGNPIQPGTVVRRNLYVMVEATIAAGEGHREEQPGDHRVPVVRYHHDRADASVFPAGNRIQVAEQDVAAGQPLYSGYSSAPEAARSRGQVTEAG